MDVVTDGADRRARGLGRRQQRERLRGRAGRAIVLVDAMPPARRAQMLAEELLGRRMEQADVQVIPLDLDAASNPAGRRAVVGGLDFDAPIEMDRAGPVTVVTKGLERERSQRRLLLDKHRGDLALGGAMDPRVGPVRLPAIQVGLRLLNRVEAQAFQGRLLGVADAGLHFSFAIRIADPTRQGDHAVVREDVAVERIERRLVDVGREHALFEVVQDDDLDGAAQPTKRAFMQLGPHLSAGAPHEQPHGLPRESQGQDKEPGAPVLARAGRPDHRALAVVDLAFIPGRGRDHHARLERDRAPKLADETPDAGVPRRKAVAADQVLPDRHRVAAQGERGHNLLAVGFTGTGARRPSGGWWPPRGWGVGGHLPRGGRIWRTGVGGHLPRGGRFWRPVGRTAAAASHGYASGLHVGADRLSTDTSGRFDAPERPPQASQGDDLLLVLVVQDIAHGAA